MSIATGRNVRRIVVCLLAAIAFVAATAPAASIVDEWASVQVPPPPALKAVTIDRKTTALLLLDFNKQTCNAERRPRCIATIPKVAKLLAAARAAGIPVLYSLGGGGAPADIAKELTPAKDEPIVSAGLDKFSGTELESVLKQKGIKTVIIVGTAAHGNASFHPRQPAGHRPADDRARIDRRRRRQPRDPDGRSDRDRDHADKRAADIVLYIAAMIMTIPSIALFGVMIPVLSLIGQGIGYVPAVIAVLLYSQLPIIRNTYTAISNIDPALREAARGMGMRVMREMFNFERIILGGSGLGVARSAFDIATAHAQRRVAFGAKLGTKELIWNDIAQMSWRIDAAELLTYRAAKLYDAGTPPRDLMKPAAMAKLVATETATFCADRTVQILGGDGLTKEFGRAEQIYRDARALPIVGGTSEIVRYLIATADLPAIKLGL